MFFRKLISTGDELLQINLQLDQPANTMQNPWRTQRHRGTKRKLPDKATTIIADIVPEPVPGRSASSRRRDAVHSEDPASEPVIDDWSSTEQLIIAKILFYEELLSYDSNYAKIRTFRSSDDPELVEVEGSCSDIWVKVVFTPSKITVFELRVYEAEQLRDNLEKGIRYNGDYTIVRTLNNSEACNAIWALIDRREIPKYNVEAVLSCPMLLALYIDFDHVSSSTYTVRYRDFKYSYSYNDGPDVNINGYPLFSYARRLFDSAYNFKEDYWKKRMSMVIEDIKFLPEIGIEYHKAKDHFDEN